MKTVGEFSVVRYVPDLVREEAVNVGLIVEGVDAPFLDYHFVRNPSRCRGVAGFKGRALRVALDNLKDLIDEHLKEARPSGGFLESLASHCSASGLQITPPRPLIADSLEARLEELFDRFVGEPSQPESHPRPLSQFLKQVNERNLTDRLRRPLVVKVAHDEFEIDVAFRRNGAVDCVQGVSLAGQKLEDSLDAARLVAYRWAEITQSSSVPRVERMTAVLTLPRRPPEAISPDELLSRARVLLEAHDCHVIRGDNRTDVEALVKLVAEQSRPWDEGERPA